MPTRLYSYERLDSGIDFSVEFLSTKPTEISPNLFTCYDLVSRPKHLNAKFTAVIPLRIGGFLCAGESETTQLDLVIVWTCLRSRKRDICKLTYVPAEKHWSGNLPIDCDEIFGSVLFEAFAVRKNDAAKPELGKAKNKGQIIFGSGQSITLHIDKPENEPGSDIDSIWIKFTDANAGEIPNRHPRAVYHLDLNGIIPRLLLNQDLPEELRRLLEMEAPRGEKLKARNAFLAPICADVWEQLATAAINSFIADGKDLAVLAPWEAGVIQSLTPALTSTANQNNADLLFSSLPDNEILELLETVLPAVLQERVGLGENFGKVAEGL